MRINEYFDGEIPLLIHKNNCLPYLAPTLKGVIPMIALSIKIPETFEEYETLIEIAYTEAVECGMFDKKIKTKWIF